MTTAYNSKCKSCGHLFYGTPQTCPHCGGSVAEVLISLGLGGWPWLFGVLVFGLALGYWFVNKPGRAAKTGGTLPPTSFTQIVGPHGTVLVQIFSDVAIVYEYSDEEHELLGIPNQGTVYENIGTRDKIELGALLARASVVSPSGFQHSEAGYPLEPSSVTIEERHYSKDNELLYRGELRFEPHGQVSMRSSDKSLSGRTNSDFYYHWPMYNYDTRGFGFGAVVGQRGTPRIIIMDLNPSSE